MDKIRKHLGTHENGSCYVQIMNHTHHYLPEGQNA